jgi:hypothetical protein
MPTKRNLDGVYFRIMRDGKGVNVCWTDLQWEDRIEFARKNNNESWLIQMIQIMNRLADDLHRAFPDIHINPVTFREGKSVSKTWLRNSLFRLTADIRLIAEEQDIVAEKE